MLADSRLRRWHDGSRLEILTLFVLARAISGVTLNIYSRVQRRLHAAGVIAAENAAVPRASQAIAHELAQPFSDTTSEQSLT